MRWPTKREMDRAYGRYCQLVLPFPSPTNTSVVKVITSTPKREQQQEHDDGNQESGNEKG